MDNLRAAGAAPEGRTAGRLGAAARRLAGLISNWVLHIIRQLRLRWVQRLGRSWSAGVKRATAAGINLKRWESGGDVDFLRGRRPTSSGTQTRWWRSKHMLALGLLPRSAAESNTLFTNIFDGLANDTILGSDHTVKSWGCSGCHTVYSPWSSAPRRELEHTHHVGLHGTPTGLAGAAWRAA
jgi:hypothetical protein